MSSSRYFDRIAIALSAVCVVHCLAVPLLVALLPIAAITFGTDAHFHGVMLWLVVPTSVIGFVLGYRVHGRRGITVLGAFGMTVLAAAAVWGHGQWNEDVESLVSVSGSLILAGAHWLNFQQVRRLHTHA
jgi:hypothetical protein